MVTAVSKKQIGLIAAGGSLPRLVAEGMRRGGRSVCCVGLRYQFEPGLRDFCDRFSTAGFVQIGRWIRCLKRWGVGEAVMVGGVNKSRMHDPWRLVRQFPDWRAISLWYRHLRHDRRTTAVLAAVADELSRNGISLIDSTTFIADHLAAPGIMGSVHPSAEQLADLDFGWPLLTQAVELEIGQSMAVRERDVIAVEAVEGTAAMIVRAGELCRARGWTLLKTASQGHDMRMDVPTIGVETIRQIGEAGGGCIGLGAGRVILIDKPEVLEAADRSGVAVVGVEIP